MATYVIGDVHGCYYELLDLLEKIEYDEEKDTLYFVGDYFDRGLYPHKVLQWMVSHMDNPNIHFLYGNHEDMMILDTFGDYENLSIKPGDWIRNAGEKTIQLLLKYTSVEDREKIFNYFYENEPFTAQITVNGKDFVIVHAGLYPPFYMKGTLDFLVGRKASNEEIKAELRKGWLAQSRVDMLWVRDEWLYSNLKPPFTVVFGHTTTRYIWKDIVGDRWMQEILVPKDIEDIDEIIYDPEKVYDVLKYNNRVDIDTGCCYGGKLTAYRLDDEEAFQVDASCDTIGYYLWNKRPYPDDYKDLLATPNDDDDDDYSILSLKEVAFWNKRLEDLGYASIIERADSYDKYNKLLIKYNDTGNKII